MRNTFWHEMFFSDIIFMWEDYKFVQQVCHRNYLFKKGTPLKSSCTQTWMAFECPKQMEKVSCRFCSPKKKIFLIMNSTQGVREEVSFSLPPPTKEENQRQFSRKKLILKFCIKYFFKATSRHLRLPKFNWNCDHFTSLLILNLY